MEGSKYLKLFRVLQQCAIVALLITALFLLRWTITHRFGIQLPAFTFFYPTIMFAALLYGLWIGLWATALSAFISAMWIYPPVGKFQISRASDVIALVLFSLVGLCMSVMADRFRSSRRRVAALEREQAVRGSKAKLEAALQNMTDAVYISEANGAFIEFNQAFATFHRFKLKEECARTFKDYPQLFEVSTLDGTHVPLEMWPVLRALRGESATDAEYRLHRLDTGDTWIGSFNFSPIRDKDGVITGSVVVARDVTEQKRIQESLRASEVRYRTAFQTSLDAISLNTLQGGAYVDVNQAFADMSGFERHELIGHTSTELGLWADPHDRKGLIESITQGACRYHQSRFRRKNGEIFWGVISASLIEVEGIPTIHSVIRDISQAKWAEEEIRNLAFFDPLTGLANRRFLIEQLRKSTAPGVRAQRNHALLLIDLDNFNILNDTLGHQTGDLLLQEIAKRLSACLREADTLGRLGGDEFGALIENLNGPEEEAAALALDIGEKMLAAVGKPFLLDDHEWVCTCSVGISIFGREPNDAAAVLQHAELALYQAKAAGRNSLRFFEPALQAAINARAALEENLRQGIKTEQFVIFYQAQFDSGRLMGAEALLRWNHPKLGMLSPDNFIPLAEETRLIVPLGNWILESVCKQLALWSEDERTAHLNVAVNISVVQLHQPDFVEGVLQILHRTGANPRNLKLELTESMLVNNIEDAIAKMTLLKKHGVGFSLDDFGTGYSSLAYLRRLPVDQLKIDRSFVRDMLTDASSGVIALTIITLSKAMALPVIAEGVETAEQVSFLEHLGCHCFQGFLFSRPMPLHEFERMLPERTQDAIPA